MNLISFIVANTADMITVPSDNISHLHWRKATNQHTVFLKNNTSFPVTGEIHDSIIKMLRDSHVTNDKSI